MSVNNDLTLIGRYTSLLARAKITPTIIHGTKEVDGKNYFYTMVKLHDGYSRCGLEVESLSLLSAENAYLLAIKKFTDDLRMLHEKANCAESH